MFSLDTVKTFVIAELGLSTRNTSGVATYDTSLGDATYSSAHLDRGCQTAVTEIMKAIAETSGHPHRSLFITATALTHAAVLPAHVGTPGVPRITPYTGAAYTLVGKRKSIEEIQAYRANPSNLYSSVAHNVVNGGRPSKLAGFYAIDAETGVIYFTGYSAVADLANFTESQYTLLPDLYYPLAMSLAIAALKMDGAVSDIFTYHEARGMEGIQTIRSGGIVQPSEKPVFGARESGLK